MTSTTYTKSTDRNLAKEGYTFFQSSFGNHLFTVAKPNGGSYQVDTKNGTCTCEAGKRGAKCCHLRESTSRAIIGEAQATADKFQADREAYNKMRSLDFD